MPNRIILMLIVLLQLVYPSYAIHSTKQPQSEPSINSNLIFLTLEDIRDLRIKDLQKKVGRKFRFREKLFLIVIKHKLKRKTKSSRSGQADPNKQAIISFIAGALALIVLILGLTNVLIGLPIIILLVGLAFLAFWTGMKSRKSGRNFKNTFGFFTGGIIILLGTIITASVLIFGVF